MVMALLGSAVVAWLVGRILFLTRIDRRLRAKGLAPTYPLYPWRIRAAFEDCRQVLGDATSPRLILTWWLVALALFAVAGVVGTVWR